MATQLCLPLTDVKYILNSKTPREIPQIVHDLFELSDESPSGLVWKVNSKNGRAYPGKPAGTKVNNKYYAVSVTGHGIFYAHRIVYYLRTSINPGAMVVRHLDNDELILGWQPENGSDEKGKSKGSPTGYKTKTMYEYEGKQYNLFSLCKHHNINYRTLYQRIRNGRSKLQALHEVGLSNVRIIERD